LSTQEIAVKNRRQQEQPVSTLIHEISLMVARLFNRQVKEMGLTHTQWQVLYLLYMNGEQTQTSIADTLMMTKPPLGKVVERLEAAGWVERSDDASDRRAKVVRLTAKIDPLLQSLELLVEDIGSKATHGMTGKEAEQLYKLLKRVHGNLTKEN
jgi:MarR family transcriptional regulator, transcriptional regulator for hemolysin